MCMKKDKLGCQSHGEWLPDWRVIYAISCSGLMLVHQALHSSQYARTTFTSSTSGKMADRSSLSSLAEGGQEQVEMFWEATFELMEFLVYGRPQLDIKRDLIFIIPFAGRRAFYFNGLRPLRFPFQWSSLEAAEANAEEEEVEEDPHNSSRIDSVHWFDARIGKLLKTLR